MDRNIRFNNIFVPDSLARKVERNVKTETKSRERDKFVNKIKIEAAEAVSFLKTKSSKVAAAKR